MSLILHSKIEDLSNELWLEIFVYLKIRDQFKAFYDLNKRFSQLLLSYRSYISCKNNDDDAQHLIRYVLPYLRRREDVSGLRLEKTNKIDFNYHANSFHFPRLNILLLHRLHITKELLNVIQRNSTHIRYLYISQIVSYNKTIKQELVETILSLSNLKTCRLRLGIAMCSFELKTSLKSSINNLRIIGTYEMCNIDQLKILLQYLPCLQSLHITAKNLDSVPTKTTDSIKCTVPVSSFTVNVQTLTIPFLQLTNFIVCVLPYISEFKLICRSPMQNLDYLNAFEWVPFVKSLSNLEKITFDVHRSDEIDENLWNRRCRVLSKDMHWKHINLRIGK